MSLSEIVSQSIALASQHPWASMVGALVVGLLAPRGLHRVVRWTAIGTLWAVLVVWMLPAGAVMLALGALGGCCTPVAPRILKQERRRIETEPWPGQHAGEIITTALVVLGLSVGVDGVFPKGTVCG